MNFNQSSVPLQKNHYGTGGISPSNVKRDKSFKQLSPDCNSIEIYSNQPRTVVTGADKASVYKNQPSRQNFPHPSASTQWQKDQPNQGINDFSVNSSIVNTASNVIIGKGQQLNGRSPVVGTRLGKIIMAAKGQSQGRSNFFMLQPQNQLAYENNLVDDFELMKNVQNLIEENAHRCISQHYTSSQVGSHTNASTSDNQHLPSQITSDNSFKFANFMKGSSEAHPPNASLNLFSQGFEPMRHPSSRLQQEVQKQKSTINHHNNNQSPTYVDQIQIKQTYQINPPPRKTNVFRLVHNNNNKYAKIRNEIDQMLNMHHQRYSSASPQQQHQAAAAIFDERNKYVQEYLNDNLFNQPGQNNFKASQIESIGRILRVSQETGKEDGQSQDETSFFHQASDQHSLLFDASNNINHRLFDIPDDLSAPVRILDAQGLLMLQKQKHIKSLQKQSQNKLTQQKKNQQQQPVSLYHQMNNKSKNRIQSDGQQLIGLQLVGSQFQTKINPEQYILQNIKDQRRASNEGIANYNTKELLQMLKRRQFEQTQLTNENPMLGYQGDESLLNDNDLDKSAFLNNQQNEIKLLRQSIKLDQKEESRQHQVTQQKSERIFNSQKPRSKVLSQPTNNTIKKGAHNTFSSREQKTMLNQLKNQNNSAINSRTKLKSLIDKTDSTQQVMQTQVPAGDAQGSGEGAQNEGGLVDLNKKSTNRIIRPQKKNLINQLFPIQIESEEEKIERILKFQKQIKAKYNDISLTQNFKDEPYRFIVIRGNNSDLVKRCLEDRQGDWQEISNKNTLFNFKWAPVSKGIRFDYLTGHGMKKMVNHFEFHDQISEKDNLFFNMQRFCENAKKNVFELLPVTFSVDLDNKNYIDEIERFTTYYRILERSKALANPQERLNQVNKEIGNNLLFNSKVKNYTKYTLCENMFDGNNLWLLKPTDYNRGRGVQVFNSLEQFRKLLHELQQGMEIKFPPDPQSKNNMKSPEVHLKKMPLPPIQNSTQQLNQSQSTNQPVDVLANFTNLDNLPNIVKTNNFVIQKYLEKPLLIKKRKFDIRLWVLVTHEYKCFLFKEGYIRTSSYEYDTSPESLDKPFIHLTNNAVQKFNENYGAFEEGNQLSLEEGTEFLKQDGVSCDLNKLMNESILEIIRDTLKCVDGRLNSQNRKFCMEIFGYDFIIDQSLKPWLIEVNTNPCLEESSSLLKVLIPRMLDDALKLTIDQVFPPKKLKPSIIIPSQQQINTENQRTIYSPKEEDLPPMNFVICSEPGLGSGPQAAASANYGETAQSSFVRSNTAQMKANSQSTIDHSKTPKNGSKKVSEISTMMSTSTNNHQEVAGVKDQNPSSNPESNGLMQPSKYTVPGYQNCENMWNFIYQYKT